MHKKFLMEIQNKLDTLKTEPEKIAFLQEVLEAQSLKTAQLTSQLALNSKALDAFSYSIGHDLNAPLTHIIGFLGLLEDRLSGKLDEKSQDFFKKVSDAAKKLALMIEALMKLSRINSTTIARSRVNLNTVLDGILLELKPQFPNRNIEWKIDILPEINADRELVKQAFTDLIHNALKFTNTRHPAIIEIGAETPKDNYQIIYIKDNGVGFDNQYAEKILGAFQQAHKEDELLGIGMGLTRVASIINKHQGKIHVNAALDIGATFTIFLPQSD